MIAKIMSSISIVGMVALAGYEYMQSIELQKRFEQFVNKGPRFTAKDGQELCERLKSLEASLGKIPSDCLYDK